MLLILIWNVRNGAIGSKPLVMVGVFVLGIQFWWALDCLNGYPLKSTIIM